MLIIVKKKENGKHLWMLLPFIIFSHSVIHGDPKLLEPVVVVTEFQLNSHFLIKYSIPKT